MNLKQLINKIEVNYPLDLQESWDCSGLQIEHDNEVNKVIVCLDITSQVVDYAIKNDVDLIISHHPLIFRNYYESFDYIREAYHLLFGKGIAIYSMHTNFDNHSLGMNYLFAHKLGYEIANMDNMLVTFKADNNLISKVKQLSADSIRVYNEKQEYQYASVLLGAGGDFITQLKDNKSNTLISSEFKHHEILYALENDITLIDVNHQAEIIFIEAINDVIKNISNEIEIIQIKEKYKITNY